MTSSAPSARPPSAPDDPPRFCDVFRQHFAAVVGVIRAYGVPSRDCEDVAQDAFTAVLRNLPRYDPRRPLRPWLHTIAYRAARDFMELQRTQRELLTHNEMDALTSEDLDPEERHARNATQEVFYRLVRKLDDDQRQVFLMFEVDGFTTPEIAQALDLPASTVTSRLRGARQEFTAAVRRMQAAEQSRRVGACFLPIALLTPEQLIEAGRKLPDVSPEMQARVWGRVMRATYVGPVRPLSRLATLTPNQIAKAIGGALLFGVASGVGVGVALSHRPSAPNDAHERAEVLTVTNDRAARGAPLPSSNIEARPDAPTSSAAARAASSAAVTPMDERAERALLNNARAALAVGKADVALRDLASAAKQRPQSALAAEREELLRNAVEQLSTRP